MEFSAPPTSKGARQAAEILDAALRCLGRDGYAETSLGRVAEEAGVSKRMVLYYFESRALLFDRLATSIGERLIAQLEEAIEGITEPGEVVVAGFGRLWGALTADRALMIAFFGVMIESVTDQQLNGTVSRIKDGFRDLIRRQLDNARAQGRRITVDDEIAVTMVLSGFLGLAIEWLDRGDTPELAAAIENYQQLIAAMVPAA
ncbi:MAG: TetR/AcrR family transcriptional regulator [Solirubrobacterales bacterium]